MKAFSPSIANKIYDISIKDLTYVYWKKKPSPMLAESFRETIQWHSTINQSNKKEIFAVPYFSKYAINLAKIKDSKNADICGKNALFMEEVKRRWPSSYIIYTDGSKVEGHVGCGFYDPPKNYSSGFKLPDETSVYASEIIAISVLNISPL